jgi:ABC-type uncharacterized transport system substrate-binding protein
MRAGAERAEVTVEQVVRELKLIGFSDIRNFEFAISGKWLQTLKEVAPAVKRIAVVFNPQTAPYAEALLQPIEVAARTFAVAAMTAPAADVSAIEAAVTAFAHTPNGGLIVLPDVSTAQHRDLIIALAARHRLPAIYPYRYYAVSGGLMSYGTDVADVCRRAAGYVDRILKGEKPADLPVQAPTKYELVINLKTAIRRCSSEGALSKSMAPDGNRLPEPMRGLRLCIGALGTRLRSHFLNAPVGAGLH